MHHHDLPDLRRLRYFVAVADAGGFRGAAEALEMAQPPLSQQIMALEQQLDQRLFLRRPRRVELTDAGRALYAEALPLLARAAEIPARLRRVAEGHEGTLCIGFTQATALHAVTPRLIARFQARVPGATLRFDESDTDVLCRKLCDGLVDVALIRTPAPRGDRLTTETIAHEAIQVALPCGHRLAGAAAIPLAALAEENIVLFERSLVPTLYDDILRSFGEAGVAPRIIYHAPQGDAALMLAAAGVGVTLVPASLNGIHADRLVMKPIEGVQPATSISLATRRNDHTVMVRAFAALAATIVPPPPAGS